MTAAEKVVEALSASVGAPSSSRDFGRNQTAVVWLVPRGAVVAVFAGSGVAVVAWRTWAADSWDGWSDFPEWLRAGIKEGA